MNPTPEVARQARQYRRERRSLRNLWLASVFGILVLSFAVAVSAAVPLVTAHVETTIVHPDCKGDPAC